MEKRREENTEFKDLKDQVLEQAQTVETPEPETPTTSDSTTSSKSTTKKKKKSRTKELEEKIHLLEKELDNWKEKTLRLSAELQNLRRRYDREMSNTVIYANQKLIESLIPVIDELELALKASDKNKNFEAFRNGVEMIYRKLMQILEKEGVTPIQAEGKPFDYNLHEAVMTRKQKGVQPGTILEVVQKGYMYKDRVLRHAKVIVAQ
ncbi:MAG TPA: nucleotide exchange factor GrpE [Calditrichae bacterium]|nr:nucleotide exchange factor GrpE [Calditrichia bacterium]